MFQTPQCTFIQPFERFSREFLYAASRKRVKNARTSYDPVENLDPIELTGFGKTPKIAAVRPATTSDLGPRKDAARNSGVLVTAVLNRVDFYEQRPTTHFHFSIHNVLRALQ